MTSLQSLLKELDREAITTRKMLERVPEDKFDWKPHEKSMNLRQLAAHVAEIPSWIQLVLTTPGIDFAQSYKPPVVTDHNDLLRYFERNLTAGRTGLQQGSDDQLQETWTMRSGDQVFSNDSKEDVLRGCFCQVVHHRAQLGVYLRLLNIPIPGSYGPSADENSFS